MPPPKNKRLTQTSYRKTGEKSEVHPNVTGGVPLLPFFLLSFGWLLTRCYFLSSSLCDREAESKVEEKEKRERERELQRKDIIYKKVIR